MRRNVLHAERHELQTRHDSTLDLAVFLKRTIPRCGLLMVPKTGHTINLEEPAAFNAAVEDFGSADLPKLDDQFDFYTEVERFEINLIKSALRITGGSQVKAAKLLKLNATTLNAKLKLFKLTPK